MNQPHSVRGRRHFPRERSGCYYERLEDCCWLCLLRFACMARHAGSCAGHGQTEEGTGGGSP